MSSIGSTILRGNIPPVNANVSLNEKDNLSITEIKFTTELEPKTDLSKESPEIEAAKAKIIFQTKVFLDVKTASNSVKYTLYLGGAGSFAADDEQKVYRIINANNMFQKLTTSIITGQLWKASKMVCLAGVVAFLGSLFIQARAAQINGFSSVLKISNWKGITGFVAFGLISLVSGYAVHFFGGIYKPVAADYLDRLVWITVNVHKKKAEQDTSPIKYDTDLSSAFSFAGPVNWS